MATVRGAWIVAIVVGLAVSPVAAQPRLFLSKKFKEALEAYSLFPAAAVTTWLAA